MYTTLLLAALVVVATASPLSKEQRQIVVEPKNVFVKGDTTTFTKTAVSRCGSSTCRCGILNRSTRIVNGTDAEENEFPYQAGLHIRNDAGWRSTNFFCGGTLISDRYVLTAAHCVDDYNITASGVESTRYPGYYLTVTLGGHLMSAMDSYTNVRAINVFIHESFDLAFITDDVAIIEIEPLDFSIFSPGSGILPVCMPTDPCNLYENELATISGWGRLSSEAEQPDILQKVTIPVLTNAVCTSSFNSGFVQDSNICVHGTDPNRSACRGDSGGPMVHIVDNQATLIGASSFGSRVCAQRPSAYSRVTSFLTWIEDTVGPLNTCPN